MSTHRVQTIIYYYLCHIISVNKNTLGKTSIDNMDASSKPWSDSELPESTLANKIPTSSEPPPRPDTLPFRYRVKPGLSNTSGKDYKIIKRIEVMNRSRSISRGTNKKNSRRSTNYIDKGEEKNRMMDTKSSELGGVLTRLRSSSRQRPDSKASITFLSRGRDNSSRQNCSACVIYRLEYVWNKPIPTVPNWPV